MNIRLIDIVKFIEEEFADISKQSIWDNSGRQIYLGDDKIVTSVLLSLDMTNDVLHDAIKQGCELIITHHPIFFDKIKSIDTHQVIGNKIITAISNGISILSYHTNLDISPNGINHFLAEKLDAKIIHSPLTVEGQIDYYKISVFTPKPDAEKLIKVINDTNKTRLGNYYDVSYLSEGIGRFTPDNNATPTIGNRNSPEKVEEIKIEVVAEQRYLANILKSVKDNHPYEEPVIDIVKLDNSQNYGFGVVAQLNKHYSLDEFIIFLKQRCNFRDIRSNITDIDKFDKVAILSGSGASAWRECVANGVSVLITGDLKHHDAIDAKESGVCIIDATHQFTESIYLDRLASILKNRFQLNISIKKENENIISWR